MLYHIAGASDAGLFKKTNQDSMCIKVVEREGKQSAICILGDGMGGLAKGELASATAVKAFEQWFLGEFATCFGETEWTEHVKEDWTKLIFDLNAKIRKYGSENRLKLGTTLSVLLLHNAEYLIVHVGDCRIYNYLEELVQITKDQSVVAREVEQGRLKPENMETDPRRNVLLQCIGASQNVYPEFYDGKVSTGARFLICSDGFRHELTKAEMEAWIKTKERLQNEDVRKMIDCVKSRGEKDNISAAVIACI